MLLILIKYIVFFDKIYKKYDIKLKYEIYLQIKYSFV